MQTNKTGSWQAQWITASDDMLSGIERFPGGGVPMGKWIWPQAAVRVYMRRDFTVDGPVRTARLRFQCDNEFTLYINGHTVRHRRDGALWDTGVADAAGLLTAGVNHLGVRAFQSADPARFTAALRGGIHIELEDGSERDELTGDDWSAWRHSPGRGVRVRAIRAAARIRARSGAFRGTLPPRGVIRLAWTALDEGFRWEFSIPEGAPARVTLPSGQTEHYPPGDHSLHIAAL